MAKNEQRQTPFQEERFPVVLTTFAVMLLLGLMHERIRLFRQEVLWGTAITVLFPMFAVRIFSNKALWSRVERLVTLLFCLLGGIANVVSLRGLVQAMMHKPTEISGIQLFYSSIGVWVTNVLIFSLLYWQIDRGGPYARANNAGMKPDWHFPPQDYAGEVPPDWQPKFIDYLLLGFSTSTSFSKTGESPLTTRAKILVMIQSLISLLSLVVVGARAINILSS